MTVEQVAADMAINATLATLGRILLGDYAAFDRVHVNIGAWLSAFLCGAEHELDFYGEPS